MNKARKTPAKPASKKLPAKVPAAPKPKETTTVLVRPLSENVFQLVMQIIDNTDFKGRELNQVLAVKMELARVAGLRKGDGK